MRPEVNNVLLSVLEEKILVLPPESNRVEYLKVSPQFRAIFTSNPEEYCGVHTDDAQKLASTTHLSTSSEAYQTFVLEF